MAIELIIQSGPNDEPRTVRFEDDVVTIGRDPTSDIRFDMAGDLQVSTRHAEIRLQDERYEIVDKDSTNGTWVNGKQARWPHRLHAGDVINLGRGGPELRVKIAGAEEWHFTVKQRVRPAPVHPHPAVGTHRTEEKLVELVESRTRTLWLAVVVIVAVTVILGGAGWVYLRTIPANGLLGKLSRKALPIIAGAVSLVSSYGCDGKPTEPDPTENQKPVASFTVSQPSLYAPSMVTLDGSPSRDPDGSIGVPRIWWTGVSLRDFHGGRSRCPRNGGSGECARRTRLSPRIKI